MAGGHGHSERKAADTHGPEVDHEDPGLEPDRQIDARSRALAGNAGAKEILVPGLTKADAPPVGEVIAEAAYDVAILPPGQRAGVDAGATVQARLLVSGDQLVITVSIGADVWLTSLSAEQAITMIAGSDALKEIGAATAYIQQLPARVTKLGGRVRLPLWGQAPNESFVVLDLARIVRGMGHDSFAGLRPVEAQILLGKDAHAGVRMFGDDQVKAATAVPGEPLGDWFELPEDPRLRAALGSGPDDSVAPGQLVGGAFFEDGILRLAVKPSPEATNGVVAHVDVAFLLDKIKAFGGKAASWAGDVLARLKQGATDIIKMIGGKLHFELPEGHGTWFDFDLKLQLPHLFGGGGHFNLGALLPSGFHIDLHGLSLGAMPKLRFPWLHMPKLGGVHVPWDRLGALLPSLPSLSVPKLPDFELGLHFAGGLKFGFGGDLSLAFPDLGDLAIGFQIDLQVLLEVAAKVSRAGKQLLRKLQAAGDFARQWVHLGGDGVLRIYDRARPDGPMLGFHLLRLLDGIDVADLAPTEIRWNETDGGASIEMGEKAEAGDKPGETGKAAPHRPNGTLVVERKGLQPPDSLATTLALQKAAPVDVAVYSEGDKITVWSEAASAVYGNAQAVSTSISLDAVAGAIKNHWPSGQQKPPAHLPISIDTQQSTEGPRFNFGGQLGVAGKAGRVSGHAMWSLEQLLAATDWTAAIPKELQVDVDGIGGVQYGALTPQGALLTDFAFESQPLRNGLFHDGGTELHAAIYTAPDLLTLAVAKDPKLQEGALASVHPSALLHGLRKLGDLGTRALQWVAEQLHIGGGKSDVWSHLDAIASALFRFLKKAANGVLQIELPNLKLSWDLNLQLPHIGSHLDLSGLIPDLDFKLPKLPELSFHFGHGKGFPDFGFRLPHLGGLLDSLPRLKLPDGLNVNFHLDDLHIGLSLFLGDLFGDGDRVLQFDLPLEKLLAKLRSMGHWVAQRAKQLDFQLGKDGVLRVFEKGKPEGTRAGFDLKKLFDGVDMYDLVPVELFADVEVKGHDVADVAMGDDTPQPQGKRGKDEPVGKVHVPRPKGQPALNAAIAAPSWLRSQLALKDNAQVHASLYVDHDAKKNDAVLFASADGSDRGIEIRVHAGELANLVGALGPVRSDTSLSIDVHATMAKGMLVVAFGKEKGAELHGHAGWRLESLLADPSLSSLVPDEVVAEREGDGKLEMSNAIDLSGLKQRGDAIPLNGLDWAKHALGSDSAFVFAAHDLRENPRIALASAPHKDGTRSGVELTVDKDKVALLEKRAHELADKTAAAAAAAFKHDKVESRSSWHVRATDRGLTVERGPADNPDHIYASYGWQHLAAIIGGDTSSLLPDDMRVGTKAMSLEMHAFAKPPERPGKTHEIDQLPSILKTPLETIGLDGKQLIEFHADRSVVEDPQKRQIRAVATVWNQENGEVADGRELALTLDLEALLAHLVPHHRKWATKDQVKQPGKSHVTAALDVSPEGVEMEAGLNYDTASGKHRELDLKVGWSLDQIIDIVTNLQEDKDGSLKLSAGQLVPERIEGSFATDKFQVTFAKEKGHGSDYSCKVDDVPGLPTLLGAILDPETLAQSTLNLVFPSTDDLKAQLKQAVATGKAYVPLVGCAIGVPVAGSQEQTFYKVTFAVAPAAFRKLLYLIPAAGEILKAIDTVLDIVSDPIGTAQALVNTPEALLDMAEAAPEVYGNIKKMGFKKLAMGLLLGSHPSVRQFVLASRVKHKMEAAGWKPGDPKPKDWESIPNGYLEWLSKQDGQALVLGTELDQLAKQSGIDIEPDYNHYGGELLPGDVQAQIDSIEHGFKDLEESRNAEKNAPDYMRPALEKRTKEQADKVSAHLKEVLASGVIAPSVDVDTDSKAKTTQAANVDDAAVNKVDQLHPSAQQIQEAMSLFEDTKENAKILAAPEVQEWIQSFAGLSQDQLGELLVSGHTLAKTPTGTVMVKVQGETQKAFVRKLYMKRMPKDVAQKAHDAGADDSKLVAAQQSRAARDENEAERASAANAGGHKGQGQNKDEDEDEDTDFDGDGDGGLSKVAGEGKGADGSKGSDSAAGTDRAGAESVAKPKVTKPEKQADHTGAGDKAGEGELRDWKLSEALHISEQDIRKFVEPANGTVVLTDLGRSLNGRDIMFNGKTITLEKVEIVNIRHNGTGADAVYSFVLSIDAGIAGQVMQEYSFKAGSFAELHHNVDPKKLVAGLEAAIQHEGDQWSVTKNTTFVADPYTLRVVAVQSYGDTELDLVVQFVEIRTSTGTADIRTVDGIELVAAGESKTLRIPKSAVAIANR